VTTCPDETLGGWPVRHLVQIAQNVSKRYIRIGRAEQAESDFLLHAIRTDRWLDKTRPVDYQRRTLLFYACRAARGGVKDGVERELSRPRHLSLDFNYHDAGEDPYELVDTLEDPRAVDPAEAAEHADSLVRIGLALLKLNRKNREALLALAVGECLGRVGEAAGLSGKAISARGRRGARALLDYLPRNLLSPTLKPVPVERSSYQRKKEREAAAKGQAVRYEGPNHET